MSNETIASGRSATRATALAGFLALSVTTGALAHNTPTPDDVLLHSVHEFQLGNGDAKAISHHQEMRAYRVCVSGVQHGVPVKVVHDGRNALVNPGDCANFEAHKIQVEPGARLADDAVLIGRYEFLRG